MIFLWLQKSMILLFGSSEYIFRLVSLVCGISALFIFWFIATKYLSKLAICFALVLFALSDALIYFSSEVKQYSCDVMVGLLVLVMLFFLNWRRQDLNYLSAIGYGLLGSLFIWTSHPVIFFLSSLGIVIFYDYYVKGEYNKIKYLVVMGLMWLGSFLIFYITSLHNLAQDQYLLDSWASGFPPSFNRPLVVLEWVIERLLKVFEDPGGVTFFGLAAFLYVIGSITLYKRDKLMFLGLFFPIGFTLTASFLEKYPFSGRLILFLVPLLLIPVAEGTEQLLKLISKTQLRVAGPVLIAFLLFHPLLVVKNYLFEPNVREDIRPVIQHIRDNWQDGDIIYVYYGAYGQFQYYQDKFGFQKSDHIRGIEARQEWPNYLPDLNQLQSYHRVWILFSHVHTGNGVNEEDLIIEWLSRIGATQKDWFPKTGASSYLYEF